MSGLPDMRYVVSANDPRFTIPETNELLRNVLEEQQKAGRHSRIMLRLTVVSLVAAVVAAIAGILAIVA